MEGLVALMIPIVSVLGVVFILAYVAKIRHNTRTEMQQTIRTALEKGQELSPELIERLPQMAISLAMVPLYVMLTAAIGVPFLRRVYGLDPPTAFFAAMPGGLQEMAAFGEESGARVLSLTLIHATRLLVIVLIAPLIIVKFFGADLDNPIGEPAAALGEGEGEEQVLVETQPEHPAQHQQDQQLDLFMVTAEHQSVINAV